MPKKESLRKQLLLSQSQEDYIKAIYQLRGNNTYVSTTELARRLKVTPASATEMLRKLAKLGLVVHDNYKGATLTELGEKVALEMIRHHRLIELFLTEILGYTWDEVHDEAEQLEHSISERMEERISEVLGWPDLDPHGDPVPTQDGHISNKVYQPLADCKPGSQVKVMRVSDSDPEILKELSNMGIELKTQLTIVEKSKYEGPVHVIVKGKELAIPIGIARKIFVHK